MLKYSDIVATALSFLLLNASLLQKQIWLKVIIRTGNGANVCLLAFQLRTSQLLVKAYALSNAKRETEGGPNCHLGSSMHS